MKWLLFILISMYNVDDPRQVLIFYRPSAENVFQQQVKEFDKFNTGVKERDIQVKKYLVDTLNKAFAKAHEIDVTQPYTLILIGRDGGEKFRSSVFVKAEELFAIIDAMPMRRAEMKKGKTVGN